jgi:two-component system sensor histidine kinase PhoQ
VRERARVVTKQELSDYLYPHGDDRDSNVLEVLVGRLRRKLDPEGELAPIETLRGRGYRFTGYDPRLFRSGAPAAPRRGAVLVFFMAGAGIACSCAHADSVAAVHFGRQAGTVYLLLARADSNATGALACPPAFAEPLLSLPHRGCMPASTNVPPTSSGVRPPARRRAAFRRGVQTGSGIRNVDDARTPSWPSYGVNWATGKSAAPLVLSVLEDGGIRREIAVFARTLWLWLGGAGVLLLLAQTLLLRWGLAPLRRVASEICRVESGEQQRIEGRYPDEILPLTDNLNTLIQQERVRQAATRRPSASWRTASRRRWPCCAMRSTSPRSCRPPWTAGGAHGRHRAAPAGRAARRRRRRASRRRSLAPVLRPHPRRAGQGLCGQGPAFTSNARRT